MFRRDKRTYAALILRRLDGGSPWLCTKRIGRGGGTESDVLIKVAMARTWWSSADVGSCCWGFMEVKMDHRWMDDK